MLNFYFVTDLTVCHYFYSIVVSRRKQPVDEPGAGEVTLIRVVFVYFYPDRKPEGDSV